MKKTAILLSGICLASLGFCGSAAAHADGLNLSSYVGDTLTATIEPYASGENNGQFYVGLTQVNFAQGNTALGSLEAFCDDFTHEISVPATYSVTIQAVAGHTTLEQEAYYGMLFGTTPSGNTAMDTDIQELIWNYTAPANEQYALNAEMQTLQSQMLANYAGTNYSNSYYLNAGNGGQSFMVAIDPASPVPEPSTLALFGSGLFSLAGVARRRLARS